MDSKCIGPGHWEIENFTVQRDLTAGVPVKWFIHDGEGKPLAEARTLREAREWIAADLDSIDLGMSR